MAIAELGVIQQIVGMMMWQTKVLQTRQRTIVATFE